MAALTISKREAEELLVRFKSDMQSRLETLQMQLAAEHESVLALEEEKRSVTPRTAEAAEVRAIKAEEALKAVRLSRIFSRLVLSVALVVSLLAIEYAREISA